MRKPSKEKPKKDEPYGEVLPGGRAFQRIQQDRIARGLGELSKPGKSAPEVNEPPKKKRPAKTGKTKRAKRS